MKKFDEPIDGISFLKNGQIISGKPIGTSTDLFEASFGISLFIRLTR